MTKMELHKELDSLFSSDTPPKFFIGGLSHGTTDESLRSYFGTFGEVVHAEVLRDHYTLQSRGFGFTTFKDSAVAKTVYKMRKHHVIDRKLVEVKLAVPKPESGNITPPPQDFSLNLSSNFLDIPAAREPCWAREKKYASVSTTSSASLEPLWTSLDFTAPCEKERKIFVGGLLYATGHESLRKFFEQIGQVESAEVIYNRDTKKSRGFGFVVFTHDRALEHCFQLQRIERFKIDGKLIEVKKCQAQQVLKRHSTTPESAGFHSPGSLEYRGYNNMSFESIDNYHIRRCHSLPVGYSMHNNFASTRLIDGFEFLNFD